MDQNLPHFPHVGWGPDASTDQPLPPGEECEAPPPTTSNKPVPRDVDWGPDASSDQPSPPGEECEAPPGGQAIPTVVTNSNSWYRYGYPRYGGPSTARPINRQHKQQHGYDEDLERLFENARDSIKNSEGGTTRPPVETEKGKVKSRSNSGDKRTEEAQRQAFFPSDFWAR